MKTSVLTALTLALLFVSCSSNSISDIKVDSNQKISFNTMRNKTLTRYANDNQNTYMVYALIEGSDDWYFNTIVTPTSSTTTDALDTPTNIYYWPGTKTVSFYAFAPNMIDTNSGITAVTASVAPDIIIDYTVTDLANMDFTIATPVSQAGTSAGGTNTPVTLTFNHMLTKISTRLDLSTTLTNAGYSLNSDYTTKLIVPYNSGTINANEANPTWRLGLSSSTTYTNDNNFIVMPQTFSSTDTCCIQMENVVITKGNATFFSGSLENIILSANEIADTTLVMGKDYDFIITITSAADNSDNEPIFNGEINFISTISNWGNQDEINITQP